MRSEEEVRRGKEIEGRLSQTNCNVGETRREKEM